MSALTEYRTGDNEYNIASKLLRFLGGSPRPSDTFENLFRKIVTALGGVSQPSDMLFDSLLKIERILDPVDSCNVCGDLEFDLLRKILEFLRPGAFRFGDSRWDLLRKILLYAAGFIPGPTDNCCLLLESDGSDLLLEVAPGCLQLESCAA